MYFGAEGETWRWETARTRLGKEAGCPLLLLSLITSRGKNGPISCSSDWDRTGFTEETNTKRITADEMMLSALLLTLLATWTGTDADVIPPCDLNRFHFSVQTCRSDFNRSLETSGYQQDCPWPAVKPLYNSLRMCVDSSLQESWCKGHMFLVDGVFLEVHQAFFSQCRQVQDPPLHTLLALIAPGVVITLFLPFLCVRLTNTETA